MTKGPTMIMLLDCGSYFVEWTAAAKLKLLLKTTVVVLIVVVQLKSVEKDGNY